MRKKKKCRNCDKESLPGLKGIGLCQYHYDVLQFGKAWADKCRSDRELKEKGEN